MRSIAPAIVLFAAMIPSAAHAAIPDVRFSQEAILNATLSQATSLARPPDGSDRMFIGLKDGDVYVMENGVLLAGSFANISPIYTGSECGLIGMAFDPEYISNRYVYFFVTVSSSEQQIVRYTDNNNVGVDKTPIVTGLATIGANHDGGGIGFGPDGMLYWSIGDNGGGRGVDQDLSSTASKVGRAFPDGAAPNDNPFFDGPGPNNDYIWARGFRNPFTLTFEPSRGRLWVNVVGTSYEQIFVVERGSHAGYNDFENNQPAGYLTPVIKYRTNGVDNRAINAGTGAVRANNVLTVTTASTHGFRKGERITLAGIGDSSMNGAVFVSQITSANEFTAEQTGPDASSGGGTATTLSMGGCITGGIFYDGSDFPAEFQDNFFFGDYNADLLMRATLDGSGDVSSLDHFGTNFNSSVDMEVGADGALYVLRHGGQIDRISWQHEQDALVVSNRHLQVVEGGRVGFAVRLAREPASDVTVTVARTAGDTSVEVFTASSIIFTPQNWDEPVAVELAAMLDFDSDADLATITLTAPGMDPQEVQVTTRDVNRQSLVVSETALTVVESEAGSFTVALSNPPDEPTIVTVSADSEELFIDGGSPRQLTFTEDNYSVPQVVSFTTTDDADADDETFRVTVTAPGAAARVVEISVRDNERIAPQFTSTPPATGVVGSEYRYDAEASGFPAPTFALEVSPPGTVFTQATGALLFVPRATGMVTFVVRATNGVEPDAVQTINVDVRADAPPTVRIRAPADGATISGAMVDWSVETSDDLGTERVQFFIDGVSVYSALGAATAYYLGGEPNRFDTNVLTNGVHELQVTAFDTNSQSATQKISVTVMNTTEQPMPMPEPEKEGCSCSSTGREDSSNIWGLLLALGFLAVLRLPAKNRPSISDRP